MVIFSFLMWNGPDTVSVKTIKSHYNSLVTLPLSECERQNGFLLEVFAFVDAKQCFASWGHGIFLPCLRQILQNMASFSYTSHGHVKLAIYVGTSCFHLYLLQLQALKLWKYNVVLVSSHLSVVLVWSFLRPILLESALKKLEGFLCPSVTM